MQRRSFLKNSIAACTSTLLLDSIMNKAFAESSLINSLRASTNDKVLVLVQLNGGNDGLNTVIPLDQYTNLSAARANILIPDTAVLKLNGNSTTGLNPTMNGMKDLYDNKYMSIIQGVSYPNPNFSHFRATDIWASGADDNVAPISSGIGGRYLYEEYPGYPNGYPNTDMPDPLAIQIGSSVSLFLQGTTASMGMSVAGLTTLNNLVNGTTDATPNTPAGHELAFLRQVNQSTQKYNAVIKSAAIAAPSNLSTKYPAAPDNKLGDQLKTVARLIKGGLKTKIYIVSLNGFDTHANQVNSDKVTGTHATLWKQVSMAVEAFQDDCIKMGIQDRVTGMIFSEFGRRIVSNASGGTDHGAGAPVIMFGTQLIGGMYGTNPVIGTNLTSSSNIPMQFDFRQIYATIMKDWFAIGGTAMTNTMLASYNTMDLFKKKSTHIDDQKRITNTAFLGQNYPNPVVSSTIIPFNSNGGYVSIKVFDLQGKEIQRLVEGKVEAGAHQVVFERNSIPTGQYIIEMKTTDYQSNQILTVE